MMNVCDYHYLRYFSDVTLFLLDVQWKQKECLVKGLLIAKVMSGVQYKLNHAV